VDSQASLPPLVGYLQSVGDLDTASVEFLWRDASSRATFTAPHTKPTFRDGIYKARDHGVGVLAVESAKAAKANALVPLTGGDLDGNWHGDSKFRKLLFALLPEFSVVFDVHGMSDAHGFDLVVGTAGSAPLWLCDSVVSLCEVSGFSVDLRHGGVLGAGENTLTCALLEAGFVALQLEISPKWRDFVADPVSASAMVDLLASFATAASTRPV